jgi:hypothetical protein
MEIENKRVYCSVIFIGEWNVRRSNAFIEVIDSKSKKNAINFDDRISFVDHFFDTGLYGIGLRHFHSKSSVSGHCLRRHWFHFHWRDWLFELVAFEFGSGPFTSNFPLFSIFILGQSLCRFDVHWNER